MSRSGSLSRSCLELSADSLSQSEPRSGALSHRKSMKPRASKSTNYYNTSFWQTAFNDSLQEISQELFPVKTAGVSNCFGMCGAGGNVEDVCEARMKLAREQVESEWDTTGASSLQNKACTNTIHDVSRSVVKAQDDLKEAVDKAMQSLEQMAIIASSVDPMNVMKASTATEMDVIKAEMAEDTPGGLGAAE